MGLNVDMQISDVCLPQVDSQMIGGGLCIALPALFPLGYPMCLSIGV